jgi:hypothetical protein
LSFSAYLPPEISSPGSGCEWVPVSFAGISAPFGLKRDLTVEIVLKGVRHVPARKWPVPR